MFEALASPPCEVEIACHEVSDDGVTWRPYDPLHDSGRALLHQRIVFGPPTDEPGALTKIS